MLFVEQKRGGEYISERQEQRAIESRLQFLETDLRRNQDALKLKNLGSELGIISGQSVCPTCHQTVASELLPTVSTVGMGLEENISFIKSQMELYRAALERAEASVADLSARYEAVDRELRETQKEVRNLRQALAI